jgi:transcriptional regulator with XRE-family HTH domain
MPGTDSLWDSGPAQALIEAKDIGGAVRFARHARGWRQADLAAASSYDPSTISRLETGRRPATDVDLLRRVAAALEIPARVLGALLNIAPADPAKVAGATGHQGDDPMRRRTVLATVSGGLLARLDHALALPGQPTTSARTFGADAQYRRARKLFDAGQLAQLVGILPDVLATAHADTATHEPAAYARLTACYTLASETLNKAGAHEASRLTADRAIVFADLAESPLSRTVAARALSIVLRHQGDHVLADEIALAAAAALDATGLPTPEHAATYALALCTCAYNAAQAGRRDAATTLITEAQRAAVGLEVSTLSGHPFALTSAQVTLYRLGIHWALGDAGAGLHAARDLRPEQFPTPERRARLHTDQARAWAQWGKPAETARALLSAHAEAPAEVRNRPSIRRLATDLVHDHRDTPDVRLLAAALAQ